MGKRKIRVVRTDQKNDKFMAWADGDSRGWGGTLHEAIVELLVNDGDIEVIEVENGQ